MTYVIGGPRLERSHLAHAGSRVEFREWRLAGTLRAASFKGLVPGADPRTVVRET